MARLTLVAGAGLILATSVLYTLLGIRPSEHPATLVYLPLTVGWLVTSAYLVVATLITGQRPPGAHLGVLRQGLILGTVAGVLLYLQGLRVLSGLDIGLIIGAALMLELFFQAEKTDQHTPRT